MSFLDIVGRAKAYLREHHRVAPSLAARVRARRGDTAGAADGTESREWGLSPFHLSFYDNACWRNVGKPPGDPDHKGYKYQDKGVSSDGLLLMKLKARAAGASKAIVKGKNTDSAPATLPTGVAAALSGSTGATVQLIGSDAPECISTTLSTIVKDDGSHFKAKL
jgi:hypothetical protein